MYIKAKVKFILQTVQISAVIHTFMLMLMKAFTFKKQKKTAYNRMNFSININRVYQRSNSCDLRGFEISRSDTREELITWLKKQFFFYI